MCVMNFQQRKGVLLKQILFGAVIGLANIIPGVSGGTFALILGIYPKMIEAIGSYDARFIKRILSWARHPGWQEFKALVLTEQTLFLARLLVGALAAIFLLSQGLKYSIEHHYAVTYGLFLGLILFSIPIPYRLLSDRRPVLAVWLLVGLGVTLFISIQVDPSAKLLEKSLHYQSMVAGTGAEGVIRYTFPEYLSIFFMGVLAVSAMVLPGISGSFVLLLFGNYYPVIAAISRLRHLHLEDVLYLGCFGVGCVAGVAIFVRLFNYVFARFKNQTIFFLIGLMVGSLYALWPFKAYQMVDLYVKENDGIALLTGYRLYSNRLALWEGAHDLFPVLGMFVLGGIVMLFFNRYEKKKNIR
jgi:putative membrane protein